MKELFEKWASEEEYDLSVNSRGHYANSNTWHLFKGWQACEANKAITAPDGSSVGLSESSDSGTQANGELVGRAEKWLRVYGHGADYMPVTIDLIRDMKAALQANNPLLEQWQPIDTAPKDGTKMLAWLSFKAVGKVYQGSQPHVIYWSNPIPDTTVFKKKGCTVTVKRNKPTWVVDDMNWRQALDDKEAFPTHWMPLPQPPASQLKGGV